ncbi:MAG: hypothetical protein AVDCRST_MAG37-3167, partial [uncultured Rubrobacteraceae bacterium]
APLGSRCGGLILGSGLSVGRKLRHGQQQL